MNKNLFYLFLYFSAGLSSLYAQEKLEDNKRILYLQQQHLIPAFSVQLAQRTPETQDIVYLSNDILLYPDNNQLKIISFTHEASLFDTPTLATLYSYAIGLNNNEYGKTIIEQWQEWSQKVPQSFLEKVEAFLAEKYASFEKRVTRTFAANTYTRVVDTTLIDRYIAIVKTIISKPTLSSYESMFIISLATYITSQKIDRNGSALSRWNNYAKEALVKALYPSPLGKEILDKLCSTNLQLRDEIEAYTTELPF